jgi:hypothetical protein
MKKHLLVAIKGVSESAKEFAEAWRCTERGNPLEQPIERLYFEDLATMLKVLTPGGWRCSRSFTGSDRLA